MPSGSTSSFEMDRQQGQRSRGDARNAGSLPQGKGPQSSEFLAHLCGKPSHRRIVQIPGDARLLQMTEAFYPFFLTADVTRILDGDFYLGCNFSRQQYRRWTQGLHHLVGQLWPPQKLG